ncbi:MAG: DNA-3-methyladenine glycosylase [Salinivirgaceae bacterium]|nr:DNA-3-methyladenine glycosylase [Salinivirgaceae bacterium]
MKKLPNSFFTRDVLTVAPELLGKTICRKFKDGTVKRFTITEVEAYRGEEDLACHASKGRTARTEVMYWEGGYMYVYLIYGIHLLLNFVSGEKDNPQAVLIRGIDDVVGPGRVSKALDIRKEFNQIHLLNNNELWVEDSGIIANYKSDVRVGVDYAGEYWKNRPWRFMLT